MNKVIKYKFNYLLSNKFITIITVVLILVLNFKAIVNSGMLFSGGADFNASVKYELLFNNYLITASFYGLMLTVFLGSSIIGPDMQTGNMYIILSGYPSRTKYYIGTFLAVFIYTACVLILITINILILFFIYQIRFIWSDVLICFIEIVLNMTVVLSVTGFASIYIKGHGSSLVGLAGYAFYNIYEFNQVPFINTSFIFDITKYKNMMSLLFPISYTQAPSYTDVNILDYYAINPFGLNICVYQIIYIILIIILSIICFNKKEL